MPTFITYASYSHAGIKGLVSEPADRTAAIKGLIEKAGGKLIAAYMTTGSHDIVIIAEAPEGADAAMLAATASEPSGASAMITMSWEPVVIYAAISLPPAFSTSALIAAVRSVGSLTNPFMPA